MSEQVLHLDFIKLTPETATERRRRLETTASQLGEIDGLVALGVIEGAGGSDYDLAFWFLLTDFLTLEPFGTHPRYTHFLQGEVAPLITGFAGADVKLEEDFEAIDGAATCLALMGPEEAYDFEVREALEAWVAEVGAPVAAIGLAIGEKQLYRGASIAFGYEGSRRPETSPFRATLITGVCRRIA